MKDSFITITLYYITTILQNKKTLFRYKEDRFKQFSLKAKNLKVFLKRYR